MAVTFPTALDSFTDRSSGDTISEDHMNDVQDAIELLEAKVGITDSAVTSSLDYLIDHIPANAVDSDAYVDGSIDLIHMSANSVDSNQYVDGSIDRIHLAADIVDGTKLADNAINSEHYTDGSIDTEHLADNMLTPAKCSPGALCVVGDFSLNTTVATSWEDLVLYKIKCPSGPTVLRFWARGRKGAAGVAGYLRANVTGIAQGSSSSQGSTNYVWDDLGTIDMSGATPGTTYDMTIQGYTTNASFGTSVRGVSVWWE